MTSRQSLSNNHFGHDSQVADVLDYLQRNEPSVFNQFIAEFPEWDDVKGDMTTIQEECDPDWTSWAADWIEDTTAIYWEDGEPWIEQ